MTFTLGEAKAIATLAATELGAIAIYFANDVAASKWIAVGTAVFATLATYAIPTTVTPDAPTPIVVHSVEPVVLPTFKV